MNEEFKIREARGDDLPFLLNSYIRSYRKAPMNQRVPDSLYFDFHPDVAKQLLKRSSVLVACDLQFDNQLYGYIMFEPVGDDFACVHWMYVKAIYRRLGVATDLIKALNRKISYYTHFNDNCKFFGKYDLKYVPWYYVIKE